MTFHTDLLKLKYLSQCALTKVFQLFSFFILVALTSQSHVHESGLLCKAYGACFCTDAELQSCPNSSFIITLVHVVH